MSLLLSAAGILAAFAVVVGLIAVGVWLWTSTDGIADDLLAEAARRDREVAR